MGKKDVILRPVDVTIGGDKYKLIYTMRAILYLEDEYGSVDDALKILNKGEKISDTINILYAGLLVHHKELTLDDLIDKMEFGKVAHIFGKMTEAIELAFNDINEEEIKKLEKEIKEKEDKEKK